MQLLELEKIIPDPDQPRQLFDQRQMDLLEESVSSKGILSPLIIEDMGNGKYLLIDGERRYRAAKKLNLKHVPVEIMKKMGDSERMVTRFHIQEQHASWTPFDKARAIYFFMAREHLSHSQVAHLLGLSIESVYNWVGILQLSKRSQVKSIEMRIPFSYLPRMVLIAKQYNEQFNLPTEEIEEIMLNKIEKKAIAGYEELSDLLRFLRMEGNKDKKLKFLRDENYTVKNILELTPAGRSIKIDRIIYACASIEKRLKYILKDENNLTPNQKIVLEKLISSAKKCL